MIGHKLHATIGKDGNLLLDDQVFSRHASKAGIQTIFAAHGMDSGSPLRYARNDGVGWPTLKPSPKIDVHRPEQICIFNGPDFDYRYFRIDIFSGF
jgi:hypothetical protein